MTTLNLHGMNVTVLRVECPRCEFAGSLAEVKVHDCAIQFSIEASGTGRCEDYPCCGHTDGLGCQTTPEMTSDYYLENPHLLHEPGSPEWYDDMDDRYEGEDDD